MKLYLHIWTVIILSNNIWKIIYGDYQIELFTALADMEILLDTEKDITDFVESYLKSEYERLQQIKNLANNLQRFKLPRSIDVEETVQNPINLYHLVKRLYVNVPALITLMNSTMHAEKLKKISTDITIPRKEDLAGIVHGFERLRNIYNLNISNLVNGEIFPGIKRAKKLSAKDCFEIGLLLYEVNKYKQAIAWFKESKIQEKIEPISTMDKEKIFEYLSYCYMLSGNIIKAAKVAVEYLKSDPDSVKLKEIYLSLAQVLKYNISVPDTGVDTTLTFIQQFHPVIWNNYKRLCNEERLLSAKMESKLSCYYFKNKSPYLTIQPAKIEDVLHNPWIAVIHELVDDAEINVIKNLAFPLLNRATVINPDGTSAFADHRISKSAWLKDSQHRALFRISKRIQEITGLEVMTASENLQVVNYGVGGQYEIHVDHDEEGEKPTATNIELGNRLATVLMYISDVKVGGCTVFPGLDVGICPKKGSAAFWYNLLKTGEGNAKMMHASCPVVFGDKWIANKWIHTYKQEFRRPCGIHPTDYFDKSPTDNSKIMKVSLKTIQDIKKFRII